MNINADNLTPEKVQQFQQAQGQLGGALSRLLVVAEQYPQLQPRKVSGIYKRSWKVRRTGLKFPRNDF